jgi:hypothetical protein
MRWLQKLGTRARLLRRLEVDLDIFFSSQKGHSWIPMADELLGLWPLLEFLWRNDLRLALSVGHCESEVQDGAYHATSRANNPISINLNISGLNTAIASLNREDLGLKVHARLICQMAVNLDGSGGLVTFFSTAGGGSRVSTKLGLAPYGFQAARERYLDRTITGYSEYTDAFRRFVVENGRCVWEPNERPTLSSMPPHLRQRIIKYTHGFNVSDSQDIRFDIVKLIDATLILDGKCKVLIRPRDPNLTTAFTLFEIRRLAMRAWPTIDPESDKISRKSLSMASV